MAIPGHSCVVCGAPATSLARDVYEIEPDSSTLIERFKTGEIKAGCDLHPAESVHHPRTPVYQIVSSYVSAEGEE